MEWKIKVISDQLMCYHGIEHKPSRMQTHIMKIVSAAAATLAISVAGLHAGTPIQLSLTPQIALYPEDTEVHGLSLNIWGANPQSSLHLGLVNGSSGNSSGLSYGLVNYAESFTGVQFGWVNVSTGNFVGLQDGWVNISQGAFKGLQYGVVNVSKDVTGLQLGVFNYAEKLSGIQIGVVNVARNNTWFKDFPDQLAVGFPILNWSF